jgi:hypothetical protein
VKTKVEKVMNTIRHVAVLCLTLALGAGQQLIAAEKEADSVYAYGRWAVLSPAAGGTEPYVASATPDAINNTRPCEPFCPDVLSVGMPTPPTVIDDPRDRLPPVIDDPRDRLPPVVDDPRDRLPPQPL